MHYSERLCNASGSQRRPFSCTNLAVIFCGFGLAEPVASIIVVWQSCTVSVDSWAWLVIACVFIKLAETRACIVGQNYMYTSLSVVFSGELELVIALFASQARALLWQCLNQTPFILLLAVCKLEGVCCFKVSVLIQYLRFYFGTWFAWSCNTKKCKGKALSLPSWPCLSYLQCFLCTAQKLLLMC